MVVCSRLLLLVILFVGRPTELLAIQFDGQFLFGQRRMIVSVPEAKSQTLDSEEVSINIHYYNDKFLPWGLGLSYGLTHLDSGNLEGISGLSARGGILESKVRLAQIEAWSLEAFLGYRFFHRFLAYIKMRGVLQAQMVLEFEASAASKNDFSGHQYSLGMKYLLVPISSLLAEIGVADNKIKLIDGGERSLKSYVVLFGFELLN